MRFTLIQTWYSMCSSVFFSFSFRCIFYCLNILWTAIFSVFPLVGSGIQPLSSTSDPCRSLARVLRRLFEDSTVCPWTYFCRTTTPAERSSGAGFYSNCEAKSFGNPLHSYELQRPFWSLLKSSYCTWTEMCSVCEGLVNTLLLRQRRSNALVWWLKQLTPIIVFNKLFYCRPVTLSVRFAKTWIQITISNPKY